MAARARSVHSPLLSLIAGARSATMEVQNDGHTVDVLAGQLKVEVEELVLELELETVLEVVVTVEVGAVLGSNLVVSKNPPSQGSCMILPVEVLVLEEMIELEDNVMLDDMAVVDDTVLLDDDIVLLVAEVTGPEVELLLLVLIVEDDVGFTAQDD